MTDHDALRAMRMMVLSLLAYSRAELMRERATYNVASTTANVIRAVATGYRGDGCSVRSAPSSFDGADGLPAPCPRTRARLEQLGASERATADAIMEDGHGDVLAPITAGGRAYPMSLAARLGLQLAAPKQRRLWEKKLEERDSRPAILGATELGERRLNALLRSWRAVNLEPLPSASAEPMPEASPAPAPEPEPEPTPAPALLNELDESPRALRAEVVPRRGVLAFDPDEGWEIELGPRSRAIALGERGPNVVRELRELSLSRVVLEGLGGAEGLEVERLEDVALRGSRFALVRGERRIDGRIVWLCYELHGPAEATAAA